MIAYLKSFHRQTTILIYLPDLLEQIQHIPVNPIIVFNVIFLLLFTIWAFYINYFFLSIEYNLECVFCFTDTAHLAAHKTTLKGPLRHKICSFSLFISFPFIGYFRFTISFSLHAHK